MKKRVTVWAVKEVFDTRTSYTLHPGIGQHELKEYAERAARSFLVNEASLVEIELREVNEICKVVKTDHRRK